MRRPDVQTLTVGEERQPVCVFDGFSADPHGLRQAASLTPFAPAGEHYPGVRAPLPSCYLSDQLPIIATAVNRRFGHCRRLRVVDASFSIVTARPDRLSAAQRLPHVDAHGAERIALVHYLSLDDWNGTAFFRHRATGFETVDDPRVPAYRQALADELAGDGPAGAGYIRDDTALFERTALVEARFDRAILYRSFVLHSGAISPDAALSRDPRQGRLTVTVFLTAE